MVGTKRKMALMAVITACICVYISAAYFDFCNYIRFLDFIMPDCQANLYVLPATDMQYNEGELIRYMRESAAKNELNLIQIKSSDNTDSAESYDITAFVYFGMPQNELKLVLRNGKIADFDNWDHYATHDIDPSRRILTSVGKDSYCIYNLDENAVSEGLSLFGEYSLTAEDKDDLISRAQAFVKDIKTKTDSSVAISFSYYERTEDHNYLHFFIRDNYHLLLSFVFIAVIITIVLNAEIINRQKLLSMLKLEGFSVGEIYRDVVLREYGVFFPVLFISELLLSCMLIRIPFAQSFTYYCTLAVNTVLCSAVVFLLGLFMLAVVGLVPINLAMKGKRFNHQLKNALICCKIGCLVLLISFVLTGVPSLFQICVNTVDYSQRMHSYENLYTFTSAKLDTYSEENGGFMTGETPEAVYDRLENDNDLTEFQSFTTGSSYSVYWADSNCLKVQFAGTGFKPEVGKTYVLFPETMRGEKNNGRIAADIMNSFFPGISEQEIQEEMIILYYKHFLNYDYSMRSSLSSIRTVSLSNCTNIIVSSVFPYKIKELSSAMFFHFDGSLSEARDYVNRLWLEYSGKSSPWTVESVQALYRRAYTNKTVKFMKNALLFVFYLASYLLLCSQIVREDFLENRQLYFAEKTEGITFRAFSHNYLFNSMITVLSSAVIYLFFSKSYSIDVTVTYAFVFVIELIVSLLYYFRLFRQNRGEI